MKIQLKILSILAVIIFVFSCSPEISNLQRLKAKEAYLRNKADYNAYLALEYLIFSTNLLNSKKPINSEYFAKKGLDLSVDLTYIPENPLKWQADPSQLEEMIMMQKRMEMVLKTPYLELQLPIQLSHLSFLYDCWIAEESRPIYKSDDLAKCRIRFSKLLDEAERYIEDLKKDKTPKVKIKEPKFKKYQILFDFDSVKLNSRAFKDFKEVLSYLLQLNGNYRILLVGHADRVGKKLYNQNLALKRADVIKQYLIANGVAKDLIELRSFGEDFPDIISKDGHQEQSNRTVGIYIVRGFPSFTVFPLPLIENEVYKDGINQAKQARGLF